MVIQAKSLRPKDLLDEADRAFDSGDLREGSRLMWEATKAGISAVAHKYGWPCGNMDEIKEVVFRLNDMDDAKGTDSVIPYYRHRFHGKFVEADIFREHAGTEIWEQPEFRWGDIEFDAHRRSLKNFVKLLAEAEHEAPDSKRR